VLKKFGVRVVYELVRTETTMEIIVVAARADEIERKKPMFGENMEWKKNQEGDFIMNLPMYNQEVKKYKAARVHGKNEPKSDTGEYNLTKEEVAESVVRSLDDAHKFLRGEIELKSVDELLKEAYEYIEEEKRSGRH